MTVRWRALAVAALAAGGSGCAYFNGMYLANRLASQAASSERAGRLGEARDRWQQAQMHAESLLAHHGSSRWAGQAYLVRGQALVHQEQYSDGAVSLQEALRRVRSPAQRLEALGQLGRAYVQLGQLDSARAALDSAATATRREVRDQALLDRGRLLIVLGEPQLAVEDFTRSADPRAAYERGQLELRLGDTAAAGALYDSLAGTKSYAEDVWLAALDSLGAAGAEARATLLVERLVTRVNLSSGAKARLLLGDAQRRLAAADSDGATLELRRAVAVARDSVAGQTAGVALCQLGIAAAAAESALMPIHERLTDLQRTGGNAGRDAMVTLHLLDRADSLASSRSAPDAFWFVRAELLRDSLHAGHLAAAAFAAMAQRFPASPWTPKALVAAIASGYPASDSLRALLAGPYRASPYTLAASGAGPGDDSAYQALEDSLRRTLAVAAPRPPGLRPGGRPGVVGDLEDDEPGRRRPVAPARPPARPQPAGPPRPEPPQ